MSLIQELNEKVEAVIARHEAEFLNAYQNHIRKINVEMAEIKRKVDENEK